MSREEFYNTTTHAAGILASAVGGTLLIVLAALGGNPRLIVGVSIFVATLLLLYSA
jgi:hemolysin III